MAEELLPYVALASVLVLFFVLVALKLRRPAQRSASKVPAKTAPAAKARVKDDDVVVYYGSQTGTAETFAGHLVDDATSRGLQAKSVDLEEFSESMLTDAKHGVHIFVMATYGEGDPTDNAVDFMKWLSDVPSDQDLSNLKFTVFGLGNKQYEHFNKTGRDTQKFLTERGAQCVHPYGEGDDDANIEEDFEKWREEVWTGVCESLGVTCAPTSASATKPSRPNPVFTVKPVSDDKEASLHWNPNPVTKLYDQYFPFESDVQVNIELFSSDRFCRHIEISIPNPVSYLTGDHLAILPENPPAIVQGMAKRLGVSLKSTVTLSLPSSGSSASVSAINKVPYHGQPVSVCDVLASCVDLTCVIPHATMGVLSTYATDEAEKAELERLGSKDGKADFTAKYHTPMMTLLEVLEQFKSVTLTLEDLLAVGCRLQPRFYSICSSSMRDPKSIHLCVAVVEFEKPNDRTHNGVCSTYLKNLVPNVDKVRGWVRRSTFHPPASPRTPVLMIGPGTGIAPFRGFVHDREILLNKGEELGESVLYFGCRYEKKEFLYRDDLEHAVQIKALTRLHTAYSRDAPKPKMYVQHLLRQNADEVRDLLSRGAHVYVCGLVEMSRDVADALSEIMGNGDKKAGEKEWARLKEKGRFKTDVWS